MTDPVDEWVMDWVREYEGKSFQSVAKGELDLPGADAEERAKGRNRRGSVVRTDSRGSR